MALLFTFKNNAETKAFSEPNPLTNYAPECIVYKVFLAAHTVKAKDIDFQTPRVISRNYHQIHNGTQKGRCPKRHIQGLEISSKVHDWRKILIPISRKTQPFFFRVLLTNPITGFEMICPPAYRRPVTP